MYSHVSLSVQNAIQHKPASNWTRRLVNPGQAIRTIDIGPQLIAWRASFAPEIKFSLEATLKTPTSAAYHLEFVDHFNELPIICNAYLIFASSNAKHPLNQEILRRGGTGWKI